MKAKKTFVYQSAFSRPPINLKEELVIIKKSSHQEITEDKVYFALVTQAIAKNPRQNKINFQILCMI